MEEEQQTPVLSLKDRYAAKIDTILECSHIQEIVKKSAALIKTTDKDQLRRIYINLGKMQFIELLQNTVETFLEKKEDNKRLSMNGIFIKTVRQGIHRGPQKGEMVVNKASGGAVMGRTKKIKKRKLVVVKKCPKSSITEIRRQSKGGNVFAALEQEEEEEE